MKKREIVELFNNLQQVGNLKGVRFCYAVAKNINHIKPEIEALKKASEYSEEYLKYDTERVELAKSHAKKDTNGEPITKPIIQEGRVVGNSYALVNPDKFDKEWEKLKEKYKKVLAAREKQEKDYKELLEEKSNIVLHQIKQEDIPEDITVSQLTGIFAMISEK